MTFSSGAGAVPEHAGQSPRLLEAFGRRCDESSSGEQDPVRSLCDTEEEAGDEVVITDTYSLDVEEAQQMHVALNSAGGQEAALD